MSLFRSKTLIPQNPKPRFSQTRFKFRADSKIASNSNIQENSIEVSDSEISIKPKEKENLQKREQKIISTVYQGISLINKFFAAYVKDGNQDVIDQCSKEMGIEIAEKDKIIIKFGEIGYTFYVVVTGSVGVYVPTKETFSFTLKEYLEFVLPKKRFIAEVNGVSDLGLPEFVELLRINGDGKIDYERLEDLLSVGVCNENYSRDSIMRQMHNKNKETYEISYFTKVAVLGDGFEFGSDALVNGKPRNATVVAEKTTFLAILQKEQYDEILKKQEQKRIDRFIQKLSNFQIANHFSRTYKGKLRKYFQDAEFKRGQYCMNFLVEIVL